MTTREVALVHARTSLFAHRLANTRAVIQEALKAESAWYVALSGGKDSTVVLDLVRSVAPATPAVISIHKWRLPETTDYLASVPNLHYVSSGSAHGTDGGWARNWRDATEADENFPGIAWFDKDADGQSFGRSERGCFLGLRADENSYRRIHLRTLGPLHRSKKHDGRLLCNPVAWWSVRDVWAYIHTRGVRYNAAYDRMSEIGIKIERQRIGPLAVDSALGYGQLAILKRGWPHLWNQYAEAHPEARQYA